mgnify:CR=1 FL=1
MAKTIFEEMGVTYVRQGDYCLPRLSLPAEKENQPIGVWGQRHLHYLKEYHRLTYTNLLTSGRLNEYLAEIDKQAKDMFLRLIKQMSEREGVTEQLKTENQMEWVGRMNNIRSRAVEIVNAELIYTVSTQQRQGTIPAGLQSFTPGIPTGFYLYVS